jgi:hypothetical protein
MLRVPHGHAATFRRGRLCASVWRRGRPRGGCLSSELTVFSGRCMVFRLATSASTWASRGHHHNSHHSAAPHRCYRIPTRRGFRRKPPSQRSPLRRSVAPSSYQSAGRHFQATSDSYAGTLIGVVLARWLMVRSNKAITSSCVVRGSSFSDIRRCLAGTSLYRMISGASGGICLAISRASRRSVRFGIWKLRLPHANDRAAMRQ